MHFLLHHGRFSPHVRMYMPFLLYSPRNHPNLAGPSGRDIKGVGLRPLAYWDRGFESNRGHGRLSVVSVVWCQIEVSAKSWSLVQRSPTDCGVSLCVIYKKPSRIRRPRPTRGVIESREKTPKSWEIPMTLLHTSAYTSVHFVIKRAQTYTSFFQTQRNWTEC